MLDLKIPLLFLVTLARVEPQAVRGVSCVNRTDQLTSSRIIPQIISFPPPEELFVDYPKYAARCGMEPNATIPEVLTKPNFFFLSKTDSEYHTLFMLDLDAPSPNNPSLSPILHLAICNIPQNKTDEGTTLVDYLLPTPFSADPHRYVFLLFRQKKILSEAECSPNKYNYLQRFSFPLKKRTAEFRLTLLAIQFYYLGLLNL